MQIIESRADVARFETVIFDTIFETIDEREMTPVAAPLPRHDFPGTNGATPVRQ